MDLSIEITGRIDKMCKSGEMEGLIEKQVASFVNHQIGETLSRYSDFSKEFNKKLSDELLSAIGTFTFQEYNHTVANLLQKYIDSNYIATAREHMDGYLKELFRKPPETYKLSDLVDELKKDVDPCQCENSSRITLTETGDGDYRWIYMDLKEDVDRVHCEYRMMVDKPKKRLHIFEKRDVLRDYKNVTSKVFYGGKSLDGIERNMFHLIVTQGEFIIDIDHVDTDYEWG